MDVSGVASFSPKRVSRCTHSIGMPSPISWNRSVIYALFHAFAFWKGVDNAAYNHAQANGYKFKFHTFVWGSQYPGWLTSSGLTTAQQRAEIEQWMQLACQRYPATWAIDVVNEPIKTAMPFKAALGGHIR